MRVAPGANRGRFCSVPTLPQTGVAHKMTDPLALPPEDRRREIFAALVDAQDRGLSVHASKQDVLAQFGVTWNMVEQIEREGMDNEWPPL
jgi:hypothetical protein